MEVPIEEIDRDLSAVLWPRPIMLIRRPWSYAIHHVHFVNIYRLYIAWYRPILLIGLNVGCISLYFRNLISFHGLKDHTFILHTPASTTPFLMVDTARVLVLVSLQCLHVVPSPTIKDSILFQSLFLSFFPP